MREPTIVERTLDSIVRDLDQADWKNDEKAIERLLVELDQLEQGFRFTYWPENPVHN